MPDSKRCRPNRERCKGCSGKCRKSSRQCKKAEDVAASVRNDADEGKFNGEDGYSPSAGVTQIENGAIINIRDKTGESTATVYNGKDGAKGDKGNTGDKGDTGAKGDKGDKGFSPTATVTQLENGAEIAITDEEGTTKATVKNGSKGDKGDRGSDGVSPTISVEDIENGHRVTIVDATGTTSVDIYNGEDGTDGKDGAQVDDSAIGDKPWSSKHIVDMLCPPLQESGNPVVCYPVAGYALVVKASWEPVQEGSGTPSPENIRPIKGRDSVTVERCGENLLDEERFPIIKTQNNIRTTSEMTLPAGTYTVCVLSVANGVYARGADVEYTYNSNKHTFTLARQTAIRLDAYWSKGRPENDENIWLVEGNEWRPYTPYIGSTNTLTLPETVYGGEVDAVSGDGQETWKTLTLDGKTNKFTVRGIYWNLPAGSAVGIGNWYQSNMNSSHFPSIFGGNRRDSFIFTTQDTMTKYFQNADALNDYLVAQYAAGTPVQICYKLAKPVPFTATGAQPIPALAGVNTVMTDADSATVKGRADPIKRITDLEDAVASQT